MTPLLLLDSAEQALGFAALIIAVVSGMVAGVVALRRQGRMLSAMYEAVMGQEEAKDRSGTVFREAQPGLAAGLKAVDGKVDALLVLPQRVSVLETDVAAVSRTQADHARILTEHARVLTDHSSQLHRTRRQRLERLVTRAESMKP